MSALDYATRGGGGARRASNAAWLALSASVLALGLGCGAEKYNAMGGAPNPEPVGAGGTAPNNDDGAVVIGTGGAGSGGDDGTGGDIGTGGAGVTATGGSGGSTAPDSGPDLAPAAASDAGGRDLAAENRPDLPRSSDAADTGDARRDGGACAGGTSDLSNIGTGDFHIAFHIVTTQTGWSALLDQRTTCSLGVFWDIRETPSGTILAETDGGPYQTVESTTAINDGKPHDVVVARVAGTMTIRIDGTLAGQGPSTGALGNLATLRVGSDACGAASNPATAPFAGTTLSNVCITRG